MVMNSTSKAQQRGFALLLSLIVVSVMLAIGLSLLSITLKQFTLSATARDSEVAFHAANTGLECMRYYRSYPSTEAAFLTASGPNISCARSSTVSASSNRYSNNGEYVYRHEYTFSIAGSGGETCSNVSLYTTKPQNNNIDFVLSNEGLSRFKCPSGTTCTTIFARGYNRPCNDLTALRTVQREITIEY